MAVPPYTAMTGNRIYVPVYKYVNTEDRQIPRDVKLPIPLRPTITPSLTSTLESIIDNIDRKRYAEVTMPHTEYNTYRTRTGIGGYARATTVEARAAFSVFSAMARGPTAAVGVHVGLLSGMSAYLKLEVVKAQVQVAGLDIGVGIDVLSKGASMSWASAAISLAIFSLGLSSVSSMEQSPWPSFNVSVSLL
ncbi:hypothetical protein BGX38DRAFT_1189571 [Terfezia claveryi]|nr:hypothetical protein BGX38DRAFT_1189571 [Terfezia claveryi]